MMMHQLTLLSIATFLPFVLGQQLAHGLPPNPRPGPHPFPPPQGPTPAPFAGATPVFSAAPFQPLTPTPQFFGPSPTPIAPLHPPLEPVQVLAPSPVLVNEPVVHALPLPVSRPVYEPELYEEGPSNYAFGYAVRDDYSGDDFSHSEVRDGYKTTGQYRVSLPDGRTQIVSYVADENGYVADVKYEGDAVPYIPHDFPRPQNTAVQPLVPIAPASALSRELPSLAPEPSPVQPVASIGPVPAFQVARELPPLASEAAPIQTSFQVAAAPLRPHAPIPPRPITLEPVPVRPLALEPLPLEQGPEALQAQPLFPESLPVQPLLPEPVAVVHDLKRQYAPIPKAGYIPTPKPYGPPQPYGPAPSVGPYPTGPAPYVPQPHSPSLPLLKAYGPQP